MCQWFIWLAAPVYQRMGRSAGWHVEERPDETLMRQTWAMHGDKVPSLKVQIGSESWRRHSEFTIVVGTCRETGLRGMALSKMKQNKDIMCSNQDSSELFGSFLLYFWDKRRLWSFFWNGGSDNIINGVRVHFRLSAHGGKKREGSNTVWVGDSFHNKELALDGLAQLLSSPDVYGHTTRYNGVKSIQPGMKEEADEWTWRRTFHH